MSTESHQKPALLLPRHAAFFLLLFLLSLTVFGMIQPRSVSPTGVDSQATQLKKQHLIIQARDGSSLSSYIKSSQDINKTITTDAATCLSTHPHAPIPVVLMTLGRSGSGSTWQLMGALAGQTTPSDEYTGSSPEQHKAFFQKHTTGDWLLQILCEKQQHYSQSGPGGIAGIKWKPHSLELLESTGSLQALEVIRAYPQIKLVRSRRNLLDVLISRHKHAMAPHDVKSHCTVSDTKCLGHHLNRSTGIRLPTQLLLAHLQVLSYHEDAVDQLLQEMDVPHISVTYEALYHSDTPREWQRLLSFLGLPERAQGLTLTQIEDHMEHVFTSHPFHNVTLGNYQEVHDLLHGTDFEQLLH